MSARLQITLVLAGPVLSAGTQPTRFGLDASFLRDMDGGLILSGAQLRGVLRQILSAMAMAAPSRLPPRRVADWFGSETGSRDSVAGVDSASWAPRFGQLRFGDLRLQDGKPTGPGVVTRTRVNIHTGAVATGALQVLETPLGFGECGDFHGTLMVDEPADPVHVRDWLEKALALVPAIGAHKSAGFGRIVGFRISEPATEGDAGVACQYPDVAACAKAGEAKLTLRFEAPFLVGSQRWGGNLCRGGTNIPGRVVKAVFARALGDAHPLQAALSAAVFRELRPTLPGAERPRTSPLSRFIASPPDAADEDPAVFDAFDDDPEGYAADYEIAFRPDWKPPFEEAYEKTFGHTFTPTYDIRTRTAVNDRGVADEKRLFTTAAVRPDGKHVWAGTIAKGALDEAGFAALLAAVPARLDRIGKTRVSATATLAASPARLGPILPPGERVRFVLETDAVLHGPKDLYLFPEENDPARRLCRQYAGYFTAALAERGGGRVDPDDLALRFFARQKRAGGYLSYRYPPDPDGYSPWIVTTAGSAFEMRLPPGSREAFATFVARGLPPPATLEAKRRVWTGNPFVPENGYGEIRLLPVGGTGS